MDRSPEKKKDPTSVAVKICPPGQYYSYDLKKCIEPASAKRRDALAKVLAMRAISEAEKLAEEVKAQGIKSEPKSAAKIMAKVVQAAQKEEEKETEKKMAATIAKSLEKTGVVTKTEAAALATSVAKEAIKAERKSESKATSFLFR